jgi:hypothetical protein
MIPQIMSIHDQELVYDAIGDALDATPQDLQMMFLAKLGFTLANYVGDLAKVQQAIDAAKRDLT